MIAQQLQSELKALQDNSLLRKFPKFRDDVVDLSSNSYLCLEKLPEINERALDLCESKLSGALASRLVFANTPLFEQLEDAISKWKKSKEILLFNSGFTANLGIIQTLCDKNTVVFSDRLNHASIIDGIRLSGAKHIRFNHCDYAHLEEVLRANRTASRKFIVSDRVFSMDGDIADTAALIALAEENDALLLIDEAHSAGIFADNYQSENLLVMGTLSKAVAGMGAYLQCSDVVKKYMINKCRPLIYSTALPRSVLAWNIAAVEYLSNNNGLGEKLLEKSRLFRDKLSQIGVNFGRSQSQIIPIITGDNAAAIDLSRRLLEVGVYVPAIRPPTVQINTARCRISLNIGIDNILIEKIITTISN